LEFERGTTFLKNNVDTSALLCVDTLYSSEEEGDKHGNKPPLAHSLLAVTTGGRYERTR